MPHLEAYESRGYFPAGALMSAFPEDKAERVIRTLLGYGEGQCRAVAAARASGVSGEIGRSVHENLGATGSRDLVRGNRDL